jgi:hypothetical protein
MRGCDGARRWLPIAWSPHNDPKTDRRPRRRLAQKATTAHVIELVLVAVALFLATEEHCDHPWEETARRKPELAGCGRLDRAKSLYRSLSSIETPVPRTFIP